MSEHTANRLSEALRADRAVLRRAEPSAELDARFEKTLDRWQTQRVRQGVRRRLSRSLAAAAAVVLAVSTAWLVTHVGTEPATVSRKDYAQFDPPDPAVLRVRASFGAQLRVRNGNSLLPVRRHYLLDVGVASDGSLYIERVTPIDEDPQLFVP